MTTMSRANGVVRLPTAAERRPNNNRYREQRAAAGALRRAEPWPGESGEDRCARVLRERMDRAEVQPSPELLLVMALFQALNGEQKADVRLRVRIADAALNDDHSAGAMQVLERLR